MEDKPQTHTPQEILSVDTIQNLDTARMALRWALERMHKLEQEKASLADTAAESERGKSRAQEEYAAIQKTLSSRSADADQRELYYSKMEEYLSLQLGGKLDLAGLGRRELEVSRLQELLSQKEVALQRELTAKRASLEREVEKLKTDLEAHSRSKTRSVEQAYELKRSSLEADYLSRMANVHEKEILHKQESAALAERQAHFEHYYSTQRAQLQSQVKNFKAEVDDQVDFRLNISEKIVAERYTGLEAAWNQEKQLLVRELESWRAKATEAGPRALDLDKALSMAEERARHAQSMADRQALLIAEVRRQGRDADLAAQNREKALADERAKLAGELGRLLEETARREAVIAELQNRMPMRLKNWEHAQADAKELFLRCDEQQTKIAELQRDLEAARNEAAGKSLRAGREETLRLELEKQFSDERLALKSELAHGQEQINNQAARLGEMEARLLESRKQHQNEASAAALRGLSLNDERQRSEELRRDLEKRLSIVEDAYRNAEIMAQQAGERLAEREKAARAEETALAAEIGSLRERLEAAVSAGRDDARQAEAADEVRRRLVDAERNLSVTQDALTQAQAEIRQTQERFEAGKQSSDEAGASAVRREETLSKEIGALKAELVRVQEESRGRAARLSELESTVPGAAAAAREQTRGAVEMQAAVFEEKRLAWEEEKEVLLSELGEWKEKLSESVDQAAALEKSRRAADVSSQRADAGLAAAHERLSRLEAELAESRGREQENLARFLIVAKSMAKAEGSQTAMAEIEKSLAGAIDAARQADTRAAIESEERQSLEAQKRLLLAELGHLKDKLSERQTLAGAQLHAQLESELSAARERADRAQRRINELEAARTEAQDAQALKAELEETRQAAALANERARHAEAEAGRHAATLEAHRRGTQVEAEALAAERDAARKENAKISLLQKAAALAEERARQAEAAADRQGAILEEHRRAALSEAADLADQKTTLLAELGRLKAELAASQTRADAASSAAQDKIALAHEIDSLRANCKELAGKASELETAAELAEERARQAQAAADRHSAVLEEHQRGSLGESAALQTEAQQWKEKAAGHLAELLQLREKSAILDEGLREMVALSQAQAARFDERNRAWDSERKELLARIENLKREPPSR